MLIWFYCSDVHIYYFQANEEQKTFARQLHERIRRECESTPMSLVCLWRISKLRLTTIIVPELRIYRFWEVPIGPHPVAMFEVNLFTPAQFGAFIPWLVINRGPLSKFPPFGSGCY